MELTESVRNLTFDIILEIEKCFNFAIQHGVPAANQIVKKFLEFIEIKQIKMEAVAFKTLILRLKQNKISLNPGL